MKIRYILCCVVLIFFFYHCSSLKTHHSYKNLLENKYTIIYINSIYKIDPGFNKPDKDTEKEIEKKLKSILNQDYKNYEVYDKEIKNRTKHDIKTAFAYLQKYDLEEIKASDNLINSFTNIKQNKIILINHTGFYQSKKCKLYKSCFGKTLEIITLGLYNSGCKKPKSIFEYCILDKKKKQFILYNCSIENGDPRDKEVLEDHLQDLFDEFKKDL